jgi:hypothetical protein
VAEFLGDQFSRIGIDNVVPAEHFTLLDHELHNVTDAFVHALGKVLQRDGLWQSDLNGHLFALVITARAALTFTLPGAAQRGERALTISVITERRRNRQLATATFAATTATA